MELTEEEREYIDWLGVGQAIVKRIRRQRRKEFFEAWENLSIRWAGVMRERGAKRIAPRPGPSSR